MLHRSPNSTITHTTRTPITTGMAHSGAAAVRAPLHPRVAGPRVGRTGRVGSSPAARPMRPNKARAPLRAEAASAAGDAAAEAALAVIDATRGDAASEVLAGRGGAPLPISLGFIGAGSMAEAMARGFVSGGVTTFEGMAVSNSGNPARPATSRAWQALGVHTCESNAEVLRRCDVVILAMKPHILPGVLAEVARGGPGARGPPVCLRRRGGQHGKGGH